MAMKLQEVHPSIVHLPIGLLPTAVGADALGRVTGSDALLKMGRWTIALTAGTTVLAGLTGLIAQEEVEADGEALDLLTTHRNLNAGVAGLVLTMASRRQRRAKPSIRYLLAGAAGIGTVLYTAYLGGKMVYDHGLGVEAAGGIREGHAPELRTDTAWATTRHALGDAVRGVGHTARHLAKGDFVPAIRRNGGRKAGAAEA